MTSASYIEKTREPADLSTFAGQAAHYAGVRARLSARPLQVPAPVAEAEPVAAPQPPYGVPVNLISPPNARIIIKLVALRNDSRTDDIVGPRRDKAIVAVRKQAIGLIYTHCSHLSLPAIGSIFNRDHTSILFSLGRIKKGPQVNPSIELCPLFPTVHGKGA